MPGMGGKRGAEGVSVARGGAGGGVRRVIVVADGLGEAPTGIVQDALRGLEGERPAVRTWGYVREEIDLDAIVESAKGDGKRARPAILVVALADPERRTALLARAEQAGLEAVDLMGPLTQRLAESFWPGAAGRGAGPAPTRPGLLPAARGDRLHGQAR